MGAKMVEIEIPSLQDWRRSSNGPLHVVFIVHLVLSSWSMLGGWSGNKLLIHDSFLLICILWALHNKADISPVILSMAIDVISILLDIVVLAIAYPVRQSSGEQFSAVMAIFNLIFRIASIYVIYQCWCERKDAIDGIYGTTVTRPPIAQPSSVISSSIPPVARSASRVSNRPPANMEKDENDGKNIHGYGELRGETYPEGILRQNSQEKGLSPL